MQPKLVTLAAFNMPYQAHLAKSCLESAGIPVFIRDEHLISINWFYSPALGGVKVQVPDVHLKEAREIRRTAGRGSPAGHHAGRTRTGTSGVDRMPALRQ